MRESIAEGELLDGKYQIERELGGGAMGVVYTARHLALRRPVAVKILRGQLARDEELAARFEQEARAASAIGHPNIIDVYDLGRTSDGLLYMVMELLEGRSLAALLAEVPRLPVPRAIKLIDQVLSALSATHKVGIVHRDLKPDNIFVVQSEYRPDFVKLLDFGISKILARAPAAVGEAKRTAFGTVMGTPEYMSPEQARGLVDQLDARTDVYAAGVVLYEMLCGRVPFLGENYNVVMASIIDGTFDKPRELRPGIPPRVEQVILKAMAYRREERWPTAQAMREALEWAISEGDAAPTSPDEEAVLELDDKASAPPQMASSATIPLASVELVPPAPVAGPPPVDLDDRGGSLERPAPPPPPPPPPPVPRAATPPSAPKPATFAPPDEEAERPLLLADEAPARPRVPGRVAAVASQNAAGLGPGPRAPYQRARSSALPRVLGTLVVLALLGGGGYAAWRYRHKLPIRVSRSPVARVEVVITPADAAATLDGAPLPPGLLSLEKGSNHVVEVRAPGFVPRRVTLTAADGLRVRVRAWRTLTPIGARDPSLAGELDAAGSEPVAPVDDVDNALAKLAATRDCLGKVADEAMRARDAWRAAKPGDAMPIDVNLHFALEGASSCLRGLAGRAPRLGDVDAGAQRYAAALGRLGRALDRQGTDVPNKPTPASKELGAALDELVAADAALLRALALADWRWQQAELLALQHEDGKTTSWYVRRFILAGIGEVRQPKAKGSNVDQYYAELFDWCKARECPALMAQVNRYYQVRSAETLNELIQTFDGAVGE